MSLNNIRAGKATVEIAADSTHLGRDLRAAKERLSGFGNSLRGLTASFAGIFSGAAISGGILGAAKSFAETGDIFSKMSQRSGVSAQALSELSLAAKLSDVSVESLGKGFQFMQRSLVEAARGGQKQSEAIAELGLSLKTLTKLSPERQFEEFADAVNQIDDP